MATAKKTKKSLELTCPCCGTEEAAITLDLNNLEECYCGNCGAEFSPQRAVELMTAELAKWQRVVAWIEMAGEAMNGSAD